MTDTSSASQSNVDVNQIATDLNNKVDKDGTNAEYPHVVSRTQTDGGVVEIWSDGYCVQTGIVTGIRPTVTLSKSYKDINYYANWIFQDNTNTSTMSFQYQSVNSKTTSTFIINNSQGTSFTMMWRAEGYIR